MKPTKQIQVTQSGQFEEVKRTLVDPGSDQVRIRVEACGVCHSDSGTQFPITFPSGSTNELFRQSMPRRNLSARFEVLRQKYEWRSDEGNHSDDVEAVHERQQMSLIS